MTTKTVQFSKRSGSLHFQAGSRAILPLHLAEVALRDVTSSHVVIGGGSFESCQVAR